VTRTLGRHARRLRGVPRRLEARHRNLAQGAVLVVAVLALPLVVNDPEWRQIFTLIVLYAGLASGLNILVGYAGLLDLGFVAFFAVGAYVSSLITVRLVVERIGPERYADGFWWLPYADIVPAALIAGLVAAVLGYPTLRARGDYLAIMTLGLGEIVRLVAINWTGLTGGPAGVRAIPPFAVGQTQLLSPLETYYGTLTIIGVVLLVLWNLRRGHLARVWRVIREDELSAESVGVPARRYKLIAYVSGGLVAGCVGVVFAHGQGFVSPDSFALDLNFIILALVIVGGAGTWFGPIVGAALWVGFDQYVGQTAFFQNNPSLRDAILGTVVLAVLFLAPSGLVRLGDGRRRAPVADADAAAPLRSPVDVAGSGEAAATQGDATLAAVDLTRQFGGLTAVNAVSLSVCQGEILGLMGPNGAGKTTLLNMLSGVQPPTSGTIRIDGEPLRLRRPSDAAAAGVARTFQMSRIIQELSVVENVMIGAHRFLGRGPGVMLGIGRAHGMADERERAVALLDVVGLGGQGEAPAGQLPYVSQRRLEIARALMTRPRFVLLDEPAAGMTTREGAELAELLERMRSWGLGVVLIEHDMPLLMRVSDRVVALDHGEVITVGLPEEVRRNSTVMHAYLGPMAERFLV
jgi:branched-chain amino acid transport system permease protein